MMMDDIVDRLFASDQASALTNEAARAITAMRVEIARLEAALKPFAEFAGIFDHQRNPAPNNDGDLFYSASTVQTGECNLFVGDFRRARHAIL